MRVAWFRSPGWFGLRIGLAYWILRDVTRHPLRFSERHRHGTTRLAKLGRWEIWLRHPSNTVKYP